MAFGPQSRGQGHSSKVSQEDGHVGSTDVEDLPSTSLWFPGVDSQLRTAPFVEEVLQKSAKKGCISSSADFADQQGGDCGFTLPAKKSAAGACEGSGSASSVGDEEDQALKIPAEPRAETWWRCVWVHERCYKEESLPTRVALSAAVGKQKGHLTCLKKAMKFERFLSNNHNRHQPYILLTDWREVKPCFESLQMYEPALHPVCTVVLCSQRKQLENATEWARTQDADRVCISEEIEDFEAFAASAANLAKQALHDMVPSCEAQEMQETAPPSAAPHVPAKDLPRIHSQSPPAPQWHPHIPDVNPELNQWQRQEVLQRAHQEALLPSSTMAPPALATEQQQQIQMLQEMLLKANLEALRHKQREQQLQLQLEHQQQLLDYYQQVHAQQTRMHGWDPALPPAFGSAGIAGGFERMSSKMDPVHHPQGWS